VDESDSINCTACIAERVHHIKVNRSQHTCSENSHSAKGSASAYTFDNYQEDTGTTAIYPGAGTGSSEAFAYLCLKLNGEAGEVGEAYAKFLRGDYDTNECQRIIRKELGDVLWYVSQICSELDEKLGEIANDNILKLADRKARGVIRGSGDDR
jgi:NTP pyrophosphatase (non-canonical NTP hydrolase)